MTMRNDLVKSFQKNGFDVWQVSSIDEVADLFFNEIMYKLNPKTVSYADSMTVNSAGIISRLKINKEIDLIDTMDETMSWKEQIGARKEALKADLFITGSNAVTAKGQLVNLDMIGNRIAGITFGPRNVVLIIGINKITSDLEAAMKRVKEIAPKNAMRHPGLKVPCAKDGMCLDCNSPYRICNTWMITEKSYPKGRIKIILVDEAVGL